MTHKLIRTIKQAKNLRRNQTDEVRILWSFLRKQESILGKFRRQEPIDSYIVDFVSYKHRLIIELDGLHHAPEHDQKRTDYLNSQGFRMIRFHNYDIRKNLYTVMDQIYSLIHHNPPPVLLAPSEQRRTPSPQGGRGK